MVFIWVISLFFGMFSKWHLKIGTKSTVKKIQDIMLEYTLIDIWRVHNPDKRQFTWRQKNPIIQRHIDYWLISDDLQDDI